MSDDIYTSEEIANEFFPLYRDLEKLERSSIGALTQEKIDKIPPGTSFIYEDGTLYKRGVKLGGGFMIPFGLATTRKGKKER